MKRVVDGFNRLFVLWITLAGVTAFFFPGPFAAMRGQMTWFFALTMFGVGMVLDPQDFVNIFRNTKIVLIGVIAQFTIMPASAFIIAHVFTFSDELSLGLILTGSAPGAMASNVLCYLAGADVAYSVSLTTVSTFLAPIMTPFLTLTLAKTALDISFWQLAESVMWMVLVPLAAGLTIKRLLGNKVDRVAAVFPAISTAFIAFICGVVIALNRAYIPKVDGWILLAVLILNVGGLALGYLCANAFHFNLLRKRALAIEIGMQNAGLGSVLALEHFSEKTALPAVIFVFVCIFTTAILVPVWAKTAGRERV